MKVYLIYLGIPESYNERIRILATTNYEMALKIQKEAGGSMYANYWIIKDVNGEFFTCKSDIFEKTYERIVDEMV